MRTGGDYLGEMHARGRIDDATAEAVLAGRAAAPELATLTGMLAACRRVADRPVRPRGELAARLASGGFGGDGADHPRTARVDDGGRHRGRPRGADTRRCRRMHMRLAVAAGGLAVAATGVGSAGFAGVLPDAAQDRFETVVESVTPYTFPRQSDEADRGTGDRSPETPGNAEDAEDGAEFGEQVREDARDGGVDGDEISERARELKDPPRPTTPPTQVPAVPGEPADPPVPDEGVAPGAPPGAGQPPSSRPSEESPHSTGR